jgi:hypothetical protein
MAEEKRFIKTYTQGGFADNLMQIWVDRKTGVNYLYSASGYSGGLTVLLNRDGPPVVTPVPPQEK